MEIDVKLERKKISELKLRYDKLRIDYEVAKKKRVEIKKELKGMGVTIPKLSSTIKNLKAELKRTEIEYTEQIGVINERVRQNIKD